MNRIPAFIFTLAAASFMAGCGSTAPETFEGRHALNLDTQGALAHFRAEAPQMDQWLNDAYGYAVFSDVGKGGLIVGGAYGKGTVYEQGRLIGYADVSAGTIGLQAGGQSFDELILFKDKNALHKFVNNQFAFDAKASAVAIKPGVSVSAKYSDGVAVFTRTTGGLMVEAAVGGQKFTFTSLNTVQGSGMTTDAYDNINKGDPQAVPTTQPSIR